MENTAVVYVEAIGPFVCRFRRRKANMQGGGMDRDVAEIFYTEQSKVLRQAWMPGDVPSRQEV